MAYATSITTSAYQTGENSRFFFLTLGGISISIPGLNSGFFFLYDVQERSIFNIALTLSEEPAQWLSGRASAL